MSGGVPPERYEGLEPDASHAWRHDNIGRLLLFAFHAFEARMVASDHAAGFVDVRHVHLNALRHIDFREGTRIVDLAARAGVTKGGMGQIVEECARIGLVDLTPDPTDKRAKIVRFSARGRKFVSETRRTAQKIEREFARILGTARYAELRADLAALRTEITALERARAPRR